MSRLDKTLALAFPAYAACSLALIVRHQLYPSAGDAWAYAFYAFRFRIHGFLYDFGNIRTYGYPAFLYPLTYMSNYDHKNLALLAALTQSCLYALAVYTLARCSRHLGRAWQIAIVFSLLFNPVALALVTDVLTDGLSLIIFVVLAAITLYLSRFQKPSHIVTCLATGTVLTAFSLVVRPANIVIVAAWHGAIVGALMLNPNWRPVRLKVCLWYVSSSAIINLIVLAPQAVYAHTSFGTWSVFPVCGLGPFQRAIGLLALKYDTVMSAEGAKPWVYVNPLFTGVLTYEALPSWIGNNKLAFMATSLIHVFMSFNVSTPFVYIYDLNPPYSPLLRVLNWTLIIIGASRACNLISCVIVRRSSRVFAQALMPAICFVLLAFLGAVAANSIVAVETRFNVIPLSILYSFALERLARVATESARPRAWASTCVAGAALLLTGIGYAADRLGQGAFPPSLQIGLGPKQDCYMSTEERTSSFTDIANAYEQQLKALREGLK